MSTCDRTLCLWKRGEPIEGVDHLFIHVAPGQAGPKVCRFCGLTEEQLELRQAMGLLSELGAFEAMFRRQHP